MSSRPGPFSEPWRGSRRLLLQSAAAAAASLAVGGCLTGQRASILDTTTTSTPALPVVLPTAALVGDSISYLCRAALEAELTAAGFGRVDFDAMPGRRIAEGDSPGLAVLDLAAASGLDPDVWIVELGTNDIAKYAGAPAYAELIDLVVQRIPAQTPLVWVDTYSSFFLAEAELFNATLRTSVAPRTGSAVADWYAKCVELGPTTLVPDGLHPVESGFEIFAKVAVAPISIVVG